MSLRPLLSLATGVYVATLLASVPAEGAAPAEAAPEDSTAISEVTVTAERKETSLQATPVTVGVVDSGELRQRAVNKIADLAGLSAGVNFPYQYPNTQSVFIRGIGSSRPIGNPSVGWYFDDVYVPRSFGSSFVGNLPDIERIEILHGPQGTLYGQNTSSGALKVISRQPDGQFAAFVSAGAGNQGQVETRGYVTGPLVQDSVSGSLAVATSHLGPDVHNLYLGTESDGYENKQVRGKLRFTPVEGLVATLTADGLHGVSTGGYSPYNSPNGGNRVTYSDYDTHQYYNSGGVSLKLEYALSPELALKSISAFRAFHVAMPSDDPYPTFVSGFYQNLNQKQYSQEFQLFGDYGRFDFVTGAMLWYEVFAMDRLSWTNNVLNVIESDSPTRSAGLYGQANYHLTSKLKLTFGLRVNHEWRSLSSDSFRSNTSWDHLADLYAVGGLRKQFNAATPKAGLSYQWTPDLLTYLSWAVGQTSGTWNPAAATAAIARVPANPEKVKAYEAGLKSTVWDGRLRNNLTAFYTDYRDYQASINNPVIDGALVPGAVIVNAGKAHTYGGEWESTLRPTRHLQLSLPVAYLRTRFDEFLNPTGAANTNFTGDELPYAPRWSGSINAVYNVSDAGDTGLRFNASYRVESSSYSQVSTTRDFTEFPATRYLDAGVLYTTPDGNWTTSLVGKNVLNKTYVLPIGYVPSLNYWAVVRNRQRELLLTIRRDFK